MTFEDEEYDKINKKYLKEKEYLKGQFIRKNKMAATKGYNKYTNVQLSTISMSNTRLLNIKNATQKLKMNKVNLIFLNKMAAIKGYEKYS